LFAIPSSFAATSQEKCTVGATIREPIGAATLDYLTRAENYALENNCSSLFVRMNTPD
jgi:membrane-bound serine protease (ClpP class)